MAAAAGHGIGIFLGFVLAGLVPLLAYLLPWFDGARFAAATALALATLFAVGASRALFTGRGWLASGLEMLLVGALATLWLTVSAPSGPRSSADGRRGTSG
jgi:VIT1/CCC1 family predicted Fe2+/Mn2+ transporter